MEQSRQPPFSFLSLRKKQSILQKAESLYTSTLFKKELIYAKQLKPDAIFILSAKLSLIALNEVIEPYGVQGVNYQLPGSDSIHPKTRFENLDSGWRLVYIRNLSRFFVAISG